MRIQQQRSVNRRGVAVFVAVLVVGAAVGGGGAASSATWRAPDGSGEESENLKLGFITPLSGPYASIGHALQQGLELFLEQHDNMLGGIPVEVVTVDEGEGAATAVPGARRLIEQDSVDVVTGVVSSATAAAVYPLFDDAAIPMMFAIGRPFSDFTTEASPYLWQAGPTIPPYATSIAEYMHEQLGDGTDAYLLASDYNAGHEFLEHTKDAWTALGGDVAGEEYVPLGTTLDFQPYLARVQESGAEVVWCFFAGSDAVKFVQQYDEFGLHDDIPLFASGGLTTVENLAAQGSAALGIVTNDMYNASLTNAANESFVAAFRDEYAVDPGPFSDFQYEAMLALDEAIGAVEGDVTSDSIVEALVGLGTIEGPRGTWSFDPTHHVAGGTMYLFRVEERDGTPVNVTVTELGEFDPVTGERRS